MKSNEYIKKALKIKKMKPTELALFTGISDAAFSRYLKGSRQMDDYACYRIADILNIDPNKIITLVNSEREKDVEKKEFWKGKVKEYGFTEIGLLAVILSVFVLAQPVIFQGVINIIATVNNIYYAQFSYQIMCSVRSLNIIIRDLYRPISVQRHLNISF